MTASGPWATGSGYRFTRECNRELNNFAKFDPINFVPLFSCLSTFPLRGLVYNYLVNKEVDDRGKDTTISNTFCFTNGMFGVCKPLDEKFGI